MVSYIILALFLIAAALNLAGTGKGREKLFAATKPLLLSLLSIYSIVRLYSLNPERPLFPAIFLSPDLMIIPALFACFLGDVLLMPKGDGWFVAGGLSFFAGHVMFSVIFAQRADLSHLPYPALIPAAALYFAAVCAVIARCRKNAPIPMLIPMLLYLLCNLATNIFALAWLVGKPGVWQAAYAGAALFFVSDSALFLLRFGTGRERFYKTNFFVMLTYISGVLLITLGLTGAF